MSIIVEREIIGDAHVHFHDCYEWGAFLEAAFRNLTSNGAKGSNGPHQAYCLVFTETAEEQVFEHLLEQAAVGAGLSSRKGAHEWQVHPTAEDCSVRISDEIRSLAVIAGSQIAAREDLEILLVGTRQRVPDGLPMREILEKTRDEDAVRIVPWGAGKWLFSRGELLNDLVQEFGDHDLFLGDEAGRPIFWPKPKHFRTAEAHGVRDLPGSDPLPFAYEVDKVGRMGFRIEAPWQEDRPAASLLSALRDSSQRIETFAKLEPLHRFVLSQFRMQLRKRKR